MTDKQLPGTTIDYDTDKDAFAVFRPMLEITGGLSLGQVCTITGLQPSTIQNWVKRGYLQRPDHKKYYEKHLSRILLISSLRDCMNIEEIGELMQLINGDTEDESDDIVSESRLYDYFCKAVREIDVRRLDEESITTAIETTLAEDDPHRNKLLVALKVMVYAYFGGHCLKMVNDNLNVLRNA